LEIPSSEVLIFCPRGLLGEDASDLGVRPEEGVGAGVDDWAGVADASIFTMESNASSGLESLRDANRSLIQPSKYSDIASITENIEGLTCIEGTPYLTAIQVPYANSDESSRNRTDAGRTSQSTFYYRSPDTQGS
jgi:hypothetical protein